MTKSFLNDEKGTRLLAIYVATLVREGVIFRINSDEIATEVTLTGGF